MLSSSQESSRIRAGDSPARQKGRPSWPGRLSEQFSSSRTEIGYWINFECQIEGAVRPGSAPSLFPMDDESVWNRFAKGKTYDAWYDPDLGACYLLVEEPPGGFGRRLELQLVFAGGAAVLALVVLLATRLRRGAGSATPYD
jgi:hypothetical protein